MSSDAWLDVGQMQRVYPGESVCGDAVFVRIEEHSALIALADGLGHGHEAHHAASAFVTAVSEALGTPGERLRAAHHALAGTRGAAAMILQLDRKTGTLEIAGVGNVECHAISQASIHPVSSPGIVGHNVRRIAEANYRIVPGDWFVLFSDGVSTRTPFESYAKLPAQRAAELIVQNHSRHDDSSCAVIKVI